MLAVTGRGSQALRDGQASLGLHTHTAHAWFGAPGLFSNFVRGEEPEWGPLPWEPLHLTACFLGASPLGEHPTWLSASAAVCLQRALGLPSLDSPVWWGQ